MPEGISIKSSAEKLQNKKKNYFAKQRK